MSTARRDNYVARTFSHMARARLDHAVSRSADAELLESEKWEMRSALNAKTTAAHSFSCVMHNQCRTAWKCYNQETARSSLCSSINAWHLLPDCKYMCLICRLLSCVEEHC